MSFEFYLSLDLLTLDSWRGQVDPTDAVIVAFIHKLQANRSEKLKRHIKRGAGGDFIHVDHAWLLERLPILKCRSKERIQKRLHRLCELGILESMTERDPRTKVRRAYYRTSQDFDEIAEWWKEKIGQIRNGDNIDALFIERPWIKATVTNDRRTEYSRNDKGQFKTYGHK